MREILVGGLTVLLFGCGGSGGATSSFSCDQGSAGGGVCTDLVLMGADLALAKSDCSQAKGGTVGTACSHTGAIGGCQIPFMGYGGTGTTTTWQHSGTASALMSDCATLHGTWLTP